MYVSIYLLLDRDHLATKGILVVGSNKVTTDYMSQQIIHARCKKYILAQSPSDNQAGKASIERVTSCAYTSRLLAISEGTALIAQSVLLDSGTNSSDN